MLPAPLGDVPGIGDIVGMGDIAGAGGPDFGAIVIPGIGAMVAASARVCAPGIGAIRGSAAETGATIAMSAASRAMRRKSNEIPIECGVYDKL